MYKAKAVLSVGASSYLGKRVHILPECLYLPTIFYGVRPKFIFFSLAGRVRLSNRLRLRILGISVSTFFDVFTVLSFSCTLFYFWL